LARTKALVTQPSLWVKFEALVAELVEHQKLGATRVREVCRRAGKSPRLRELYREAQARQEAEQARIRKQIGIEA
jgi:hypothetical protein